MKARLVDGFGNSMIEEVYDDAGKLWAPDVVCLRRCVNVADGIEVVRFIKMTERDKDGLLVYRQDGVRPAPIRYDASH